MAKATPKKKQKKPVQARMPRGRGGAPRDDPDDLSLVERTRAALEVYERDKQDAAAVASAAASIKPSEEKLAFEIGRRLVEAREGSELSQHALAERSKAADPFGIGISRSTLSLYETGVNKPGAREIVVLCEALNITPNWLLYGSDAPQKQPPPNVEMQTGDDLDIAVRLAMAMLVLDPPDRLAFQTLVFSTATKKLSLGGMLALMGTAATMKEAIVANVTRYVGDEASSLPMVELLRVFVERAAVGAFLPGMGPVLKSDPGDQFRREIEERAKKK